MVLEQRYFVVKWQLFLRFDFPISLNNEFDKTALKRVFCYIKKLVIWQCKHFLRECDIKFNFLFQFIVGNVVLATYF